MFNIFKSRKLPLLDPKLFTKMTIGFQNKLWEKHPYFLSINWNNDSEYFNCIHSYYKNSEFFYQLAKVPGKNLIPASGDLDTLQKQYLLYLDVSLRKISEHLIEKAEEVKKEVIQNNPIVDLPSEEKNFSWLEATLNVLFHSIEKNATDPNFLFQYEIYFNQEDEETLKIKCFNLHFEVLIKEAEFQVTVLDTKNNEHEPANRYDLKFVEQIPRAIDLFNNLFKNIRDYSITEVVS